RKPCREALHRVRDGALAHIILLAEVVADLDQHSDAFGIARSGYCRVVGLGAEFPRLTVAKYGDPYSVRTVEVSFQLKASHRDKFGFGFHGFAHDGFLRAQ